MKNSTIERLSRITQEEQSILQGQSVDLSLYNYAGNAVMQPGKLLPGGELFGIRTHTRFVDFPRHGHEYVEMIYQVQGQTRHVIDGSEALTLTAGKLLFLSRGTQHEIKAAGKTDIAVNFLLIPTFFDNAAISIGENNALSVFLKGNLNNHQVASGHLVFDVSQSPLIENLLENLVIGQWEGVSLSVQQLTLELLMQHLSGMAEHLVVNSQLDREKAMVLRILAQIEQHVQINLSETAQELGMDVSALSRLFRKHTGCTFTELLHTARFNRAIVLLRDTDLSVADIAATVGYENTGFFYRRFAQRYGCTPAEYRRRCAASQNRI